MKPYFYDEQLYKVSCYSYADFIKTLAELQTLKPIDVNRTLFSPQYLIQHEDGSHEQFHAWYNLFPVLEEKYGIDVDVKKSQVNLQNFFLFLKSPLVIDGEETAVTDAEDAPEVEQEPVVEEENDVVEDEPSSPLSNEEKEYIFSMYNDKLKNGSKDKLEAYAIEKYGIDLSKRKSFENMVKELEEALS